jgi:signal peptidase I
MNNDVTPVQPEENVTLYSHNGGSLSLSGPALAGLTREILGKGLPFRFTAPGFSMSPFIRDGDVITLAPYKADSCRPGVVVAFVRPGTERLVVHRVVAVSKNGCHIRGDNAPDDDGDIPHASIIGQVVRIEHAGKTVRFGMGPERKIIAVLSRRNWLHYCTGAARAVCSVIRRFS